MKHLKVAIITALLPAILYAHGGGRDIKGTIVKVEPRSVVVKRLDGQTEAVPLTAATTYRVGNTPGHFEDMHVGSRVVVHIGHDGNALEVHLPAKK